MDLLKYRCENCTKVFYIEKTETPGHTMLACPHCSNSFEGVKHSWADDEIKMMEMVVQDPPQLNVPNKLLVASIGLSLPDVTIGESLGDLISRVVEELPEDMRIAMAAGCKVEHIFEDNKYIIRTVNPIAISRPYPNHIVVGEKIGEEIKITTLGYGQQTS